MSAEQSPPHADHGSVFLGWQDSEHLYLVPEGAFQAVSLFARDSGAPFPISQSRLRKDLVLEGLSKPDPDRHTASVWVGGQTRRVLKLIKSKIAEALGEETSPLLTALTGFQE